MACVLRERRRRAGRSLPGLARLLATLREENGAPPAAEAPSAPPAEVPAPAPPQAPAPAPEAPVSPAAEPAPPSAETDETLLGAVAAAMALVKAYRMHGHLAAHLDPLGSEPVGDPALEPERLVPRLTPELQAQVPASVLRVGFEGETLADVLPRLEETYCGTIAYEIEHISDHQERVWLRQAIETGRYRQPFSTDEHRRLLEQLTQVEVFEHYLRRAFLGQKQFSIEGLDVLVPMLDEAVELGAEAGAHGIVIGMAHRGRLNVLAHIIDRPYEEILREFEGERTIEAVAATAEGASGDVKYHLGAVGRRATHAGTGDRHARCQPEPSRGGRPGRRRHREGGADRPLLSRWRARPGGRASRSSSTATPPSRGRASSPRR